MTSAVKVSLSLVLWMQLFSMIAAGPVPAAQSNKEQLEALQKLLLEMSKKNGAEATADKVPQGNASVTHPPTTTTTTTTAPPAVENVAMRELPNVESAEENLRKLVSQLTPADIAALQVVRAKLINLKNRLDAENQINEINSALRNIIRSRGGDTKTLENLKGQNKRPAQHGGSVDEDLGTFLSHPLPEHKLGMTEIDHKRLKEQGSNQQRPSGGHVLPAETSDGSFEPFVRELYRQNVLHTVKRNLLQSLKLARDSGISLKEVLQALEQNQDTSKAESELQSLTKHE